METLVRLAGLAQLALCVVSVWIPHMLKLPRSVSLMPDIARHLFWTYAGYILVINFGMGLLSAVHPELLVASLPLAGYVTSAIAVYWGARMVIQFVSFAKSAPDTGIRHAWAYDVALKMLFTGLTLVYAFVAWHDWTGARL